MNKNLHYCILGLGITGVSCVKFLVQQQCSKITAIDIKCTIQLLALQQQYNQVQFILGEFTIPDDAEILIISPGIDPLLPAIQQAVQKGAKLTNDINIFLEYVNIFKKSHDIQIAAITGTNGKTTVVNMLASVAKQHHVNYALCGNVGDPVLDFLSTEISLYILELSSFQLELLPQLSCNKIFDVACILNITPDHLDRYKDFSAYCNAKLNIYNQAKNIVYYQEDLNTKPIDANANIYPFSLSSMQNNKHLSQLKELCLLGEHNFLNALACCTIGKLLNFSMANMFNALKNFTGLEHRCQLIGNFNGIYWINDSKGTNIGATIAAINSTVKHYNAKIIIILGGVSKKADLLLLKNCVITNCKAAIFIGECQEQLFTIFNNFLACYKAIDLKTAVSLANQVADKRDVVLLSPACASFDMFDNYKHRGEIFKHCVLELNHANNL